MLFVQSYCIRAKVVALLSSGNVVVIGQKLLYSGKVVLFGQN